MTFRSRLFLTSLATVTLALLFATLLVSWSVRQGTDAQIERALVSQARLAAAMLGHRQAMTRAELDGEADTLGTIG